MKESGPPANRSFHLSKHLCQASEVPCPPVAAAVEIKARVSEASEVCGEGDRGPREAQLVTEHLDCLSDLSVNSGAPNMVPACLTVR